MTPSNAYAKKTYLKLRRFRPETNIILLSMMTNNQRERLYVFLFISGRAPNWVIEWSFLKGTGAKRLKSNLKCGPAEDPSADYILASHAGVFIDFQKNPSSDLICVERPLATSSLAWQFRGLKGSLRSLRNSWGQLVASLTFLGELVFRPSPQTAKYGGLP